MIAIAIINYRTATTTLECVRTLLSSIGGSTRIFLLDNGSGNDEAARLQTFSDDYPEIITFVAQAQNIGFAAGMNQLLRLALASPETQQVLLLNSDTRPAPGFLAAMQSRLDSTARIDMIAARLLHPDNDSVESMGIALYRSTLASNRKHKDEILLGPTGGCALFTRRLLEDLLAKHGEWFDETFFCYAEDTDLVLRARWLGYKPAYAADAIVYHEGSLSSGGPDNEFVLYHGIRNSIFWLAKDAPFWWFVRSLPWFLALHCGICLRHLKRGRGRVLWRLYRDAICGLPAMLRKRQMIVATRCVSAREFRHWIEPHFYEPEFMRRAWRELWKIR